MQPRTWDTQARTHSEKEYIGERAGVRKASSQGKKKRGRRSKRKPTGSKERKLRQADFIEERALEIYGAEKTKGIKKLISVQVERERRKAIQHVCVNGEEGKEARCLDTCMPNCISISVHQRRTCAVRVCDVCHRFMCFTPGREGNTFQDRVCYH